MNISNKTEYPKPMNSLSTSHDDSTDNSEIKIKTETSQPSDEIHINMTKMRDKEYKNKEEEIQRRLKMPVEFKCGSFCHDCELCCLNHIMFGVMTYTIYSTTSQKPEEGFKKVTILITSFMLLITITFSLMLLIVSVLSCCLSMSWIIFKLTMPKTNQKSPNSNGEQSNANNNNPSSDSSNQNVNEANNLTSTNPIPSTSSINPQIPNLPNGIPKQIPNLPNGIPKQIPNLPNGIPKQIPK